MLLGTLGASLLGSLLSRKGIVRADSGNKEGKGIVRAASGNKKRKRNCKGWFWSSSVLCFTRRLGFLMPSHPLTNFEIQKYYENEKTRVFS